MKKRLIILGALIFTVATVLISIFIVQPPKPIIEIRGEALTTIGPLDILNTLFTAWVVMALLLIVCFIALRGRGRVQLKPGENEVSESEMEIRRLTPSGFYNLFEALIEAIDNFIASIAGQRNSRRFFPLIATFFIYIAFANWLSLTPLFNTIGVFVPLHAEEAEFHEHALVFDEGAGLNLILFGAEDVELHADDCAAGHAGDECREHAIEAATAAYTGEGEKLGVLFPFLRGINTDLMTPLSFALISAFFVEYWGVTSVGFFRYLRKFFNWGGFLKGIFSLKPGEILNGFIDGFVSLLEFVAEVARLISFTFRLFGNMLAGEILLLVMTFLVAVSTPILLFFYGLELFVGMIQAFVFGTLTLVFAVLAVSAHGGEEHSEEVHH